MRQFLSVVIDFVIPYFGPTYLLIVVVLSVMGEWNGWETKSLAYHL